MKLTNSLIIFLSLMFSAAFGQVDIKIASGPQWSNAYNVSATNNQIEYDFRTGFHVNGLMLFRTSKALQLYGGLGVSINGTVFRDKLIFFDQLEPNELQEDLPDFKFISTFLQLEIPIGFLYYFKNPSQGLFIDGSLKPVYTIEQFSKSIIRATDGSENVNKSRSNDIPKKFNIAIKAGLGYEFSKLNNLSLTAFGEIHTLNWAINEFKYYQYTMGLSIGMRI